MRKVKIMLSSAIPKKPLLYLRRVEDLKRYSNTTGMYHFALLYPSEKELAKAIAMLFAVKYPNSPTRPRHVQDHLSEGSGRNDIELYVRTIRARTLRGKSR